MTTIKSFDCGELSPLELQQYLQHAIAPRPICLASTIDGKGHVNLSPFSFFNLFSTSPPVCIFSPSRRVRDNTIKHTLENVMEVAECVVNVVDYAMIQQMNLSSGDFPRGVNEFEKAGFTMLDSQLVRPPRVAEAPVQMECVVTQVIPLGDTGGSGNLVLAEIKRIHLRDRILDQQGRIDQQKLQLVARLGGDWYCRVLPEQLFKLSKPAASEGIGVDCLPSWVRESGIFTGNQLGVLGSRARLPGAGVMFRASKYTTIQAIFKDNQEPGPRAIALQLLARELMEKGNVAGALEVLMVDPNLKL